MARAKTDCYQIDGQPMLAPDTDASFSFSDLDASDSGRTEDGVMHRIWCVRASALGALNMPT